MIMRILVAIAAMLVAPVAWAQVDPGDVPRQKAPSAAAAQADPMIANIYTNSLGGRWENWSFATVETSVDVGGARKPIRVEADGYKALYLHHESFDATPYRGLTFLIQGTGDGGTVRVIATTGTKPVEGKQKLVTVKAGGWTKVTVSLADLGIDKAMDGFWLQNDSDQPMPAFYVADIALIP